MSTGVSLCNALVHGKPLNLGPQNLVPKKLETSLYRAVQTYVVILNRLRDTCQCDGRTDGQTDGQTF